MTFAKSQPRRPKAPDEFNVIIEIPMNADPIKYEVDKASGMRFSSIAL